MASGAVVISDMSNFTFGHAAKVDLMTAKHSKVIMEEGYAGRTASIHFVHCNSIVDSVIKLIKSVLKPKLSERVQSHKNFEELWNFIPKEYLPSDFGGDLKSYQSILDDWKKVLIEFEPHFQKLNSQKVNEQLRPKTLYSEQFIDLQGNFRQLAVD